MGVVDDFCEVRSAVLHLKSVFGSYAALGRIYDASFTSFWWVGEKGVDLPIIRRVLGFRPKSVEVEPCGKCGRAHTVGWCVEELGQPRKPSRNGHRKRKRYPRLQIRKDDMESAARSITRNLPAERVEELVQEITLYNRKGTEPETGDE